MHSKVSSILKLIGVNIKNNYILWCYSTFTENLYLHYPNGLYFDLNFRRMIESEKGASIKGVVELCKTSDCSRIVMLRNK